MASQRFQNLDRFGEILDTLDAIVWEAVPSTFEFTYVSEGAFRMLGYPLERWIGNPGFWESLIHPDDLEHTVAFCRAAAKECRDHQFEYRVIAADGRVLSLHDVVRVIPDDDGRACLLRGVMTDITEQVEAKARLAESEERYRLLSELTSDYAWSVVADASGRFVFEWATDAIERVHGRRPDEVVGMTWMDVVHPDDRFSVEQDVQHVAAGGTIHRELRIVRPDGEIRWVSGVARRADAEDGTVRIVGSSRDITERKRAEQKLDASERRFRAVFDNVPLGISTVDLEGRPILFNQALVEMLGYTPDELRKMRFVDFSVPEDGQEDWRLYQELQRGDRDSYAMEKRYITAEGTTRWGHLIASLIRDDEGKPVCGIGIVQDVTERKEAEREREHLQEQLLQSQKMEAVGRLAGGVAHDFNNILAAILNFAAFIRDQPHDPGAVANDAAEIMAAAERAAALTRQLLVFSRREPPRLQILDLGEVVARHSEMLLRMLGENVVLDLDVSPVPAVAADRIQIEQVLLNLAVNARDAMPHGGPLTISLDMPGDQVRLRVSDAGVGMPEHVRDRAFEPFFTTKDPFRGTGLGLATVYGIIEALGGTTQLHSTEGEGTTVEILLPPAPAGAAPGQLDAPTFPQPKINSVSVLLVEDAEQVQKIVQRMLIQDGHDVTVATNAEEALLLAEKAATDFDVMVTDVVMPGMSGIELAKELRQRSPRTAIVFVSGYPRDVVGRQGELGGPLIEKPFTIEALRAAIAKALLAARS